MSSKLIFEIGTEEIPARLMDSALSQLKNGLENQLKENRIAFQSVNTYGTPRRITAVVYDIAQSQKDLEEEVKGPSLKAAYDNEGNPTRALEGFLKSQGAVLESVTHRQMGNSEYIYITKLSKGQSTIEILKTLLPQVVQSISFPRSMRWGGKNLKFIRPIRWLLTVMDNQTIEFDLEGIASSNITRGHRFLGDKNIIINTCDEYFDLLEKNYVIVDQNKRRQLILEQTRNLAKELGGTLLEDDELLEEVTFLVEYPKAIHGNFDKSFLDLPMEAIATPMKEHQRYFPVMDNNNKLLPYFITVRNGVEQYKEIVAKGNERVLRARLEDAKFFYNEDLKVPFENYVERLKNVVFQESLGTIYQKSQRTDEISKYLIKTLKIDQSTKEKIARTIYLSKADTVTNMVYEFTELQGIMGKEYAKKWNEDEDVALGIYEHHLPRSSSDSLPKSEIGRIVSISDKMDTIAGCFGIGIQPSGSQDPYGLRRQAMGIINIIVDADYDISLMELISSALEVLEQEGRLKEDKQQTLNSIIDFFMLRLKTLLSDMEIRYDVVDSILSSKDYYIGDMIKRAEILNQWVAQGDINPIMTAFNRASNLASKSQGDSLDESLFENDSERNLYGIYCEVRQLVEQQYQKKQYNEILKTLETLVDPINLFFDNTMVMADDQKIKNNRLALLLNISKSINSIGDMSKIVYK